MSDADENTSRARRSPALIATAVALPVAVVACFVVFLILGRGAEQDARAAAEAGHLKSISAPLSAEPSCSTLIAAIPNELGGFHRDSSDGEPAGFARWSDGASGNVEVRCGTGRPSDLTPTSKLQMVNGVQWLQSTPEGAPAPDGGSYWTAVDHRPYVTVWVPDSAGTAAMQATSDAITAKLQPASLDLGR